MTLNKAITIKKKRDEVIFHPPKLPPIPTILFSIPGKSPVLIDSIYFLENSIIKYPNSQTRTAIK